jgi:hypothetical protein
MPIEAISQGGSIMLEAIGWVLIVLLGVAGFVGIVLGAILIYEKHSQ